MPSRVSDTVHFLDSESPSQDCTSKYLEGWKVVVSTDTEGTRENDESSIFFNNVYKRRDDGERLRVGRADS